MTVSGETSKHCRRCSGAEQKQDGFECFDGDGLVHLSPDLKTSSAEEPLKTSHELAASAWWNQSFRRWPLQDKFKTLSEKQTSEPECPFSVWRFTVVETLVEIEPAHRGGREERRNACFPVVRHLGRLCAVLVVAEETLMLRKVREPKDIPTRRRR